MIFSRKYVLFVACLFLLVAHASSFSFVSCSTSASTDEHVSTDGADIIIPREEGGPPDKYCYPKSEPHRKRTGSWALGPASLAPNSRDSQVAATATDSQGNIILLVISDHVPILMKIGSDSVPLWTYHLPPDSYGDVIQLDPQDNIYIPGIASGELKFGSSTILVPQEKTYYVLFKFSPQGQPLSLRHMPDHFFFTTFSLSARGELYVAGYADYPDYVNISVPDVSERSARVVVGKYGVDGALLWIHAIYSTPSRYCTLSRMVVDSQENIYLTGSFYGDLQFGVQNSLTLSASPPPKDGTDSNIFVTKLDKHGSFQWASYAGTHTANKNSSSTGTHSDIVVDKAGNVYITGSWQSTRTFGSLSLPWVAPIFIFVAKLTPAGIFAWAIPGPSNKDVSYKGVYSPFAHRLHLTSDGSLVLTGNGYDGGSKNIFSAHFDTTGKWLSIVRLGYSYDLSTTPGYPTPTSLDNQGNLFVAGEFYYGARIGGSKLHNIGCPPGDGPSAFLWRLEKP